MPRLAFLSSLDSLFCSLSFFFFFIYVDRDRCLEKLLKKTSLDTKVKMLDVMASIDPGQPTRS